MAARENPRLPHVGDEITVSCDSLVEVASPNPGMPPTWRYLAAGSRGRLIGWRERKDDARAVIDVKGVETRLVVFVKEHSVDRV